MTRLLLIVCILAFFGLGFDASGPPDVGTSEAFAQEHGAETAPDVEEAHTEGEEEHGEDDEAHAADELHLDGAQLGLIWVVPFVGILLSIAIMPLVLPQFWHRHFGKVAAVWALCFLVPFALLFGWQHAVYELLHVALLEYIPFIILLGALFTVAGGVRVTGTLKGTPIVNVAILAIGTAIASLMGTTGAAMLLIRPLLNANENRRHKVHTVVFFIFLVANIGGSLSPLGDPPLFLGFLKGVSFFWPTTHLFFPMLMVSVILLIAYYILDVTLFAREGGLPASDKGEAEPAERLGLEGKINILLIGGVVAAVLMSGIWRPHIEFLVYGVHVELQNLVRDLVLIGLAFLSLHLTNNESRKRNGFTWFPILEVAKLFAGIFVTIIPAIAILRAGTDGALATVVSAVSDNGQPNDIMYFWLTGILSSFLDNAPTYLVFFNTAGGNAETLMTELSSTLVAISAGAVFMGANTYIGNAPNFMVRSIAQERGVPMPSFLGYMAWSGAILIPLFVVVTFVFL